jgi:hypothetical protein
MDIVCISDIFSSSTRERLENVGVLHLVYSSFFSLLPDVCSPASAYKGSGIFI